jgi:predicted aspartyl protease
MRYEIKTFVDEDTGETIIPLPPELFKKMNWNEHTVLEINQTANGFVIGEKKQ